MIKFLFTAKTVTVSNCPPATLLLLKNYLKVPVKNRFFVMRRSRYGWDGTVDFFNLKTESFSRGLWPQVKHFLKDNKLEYELVKLTPVLLQQINSGAIGSNLILRDNQLAALNRWLAYDGFGVMWCPPGWGKTELAAASIAVLDKKFNNVLFLVNSLDLLLQTKERFEARLNRQIGIIGGHYWEPKRITVATIQTLHSALKKKDHDRNADVKKLLQTVDFIINDECHHSRSTQIRSVLSRTKARYSLGLSARPFHVYDTDLQRMTAEDAIILAYLGPIVYRETATDLIEKGQLAKPHVLLIPINHPLADEMSWPQARKLMYVSAPLLDSITQLTQSAAAAGQATLVITGSSLTFNRRVTDRLIKADIKALELTGKVDKVIRQEARLDLNTSELQAAVATTIYDEGVDIPNLRQLILASGGKSLIKTDQRFGRGLRKKSGGQNVAVITEFIHYGNKHLQSHSYTRLKRYLEEAAYELYLVRPQQHSDYVQRILKDRAKPLTQLPDEQYFKRLATEQKAAPPMA